MAALVLDSVPAVPGTVFAVPIKHASGQGNASERPSYELKVTFD